MSSAVAYSCCLAPLLGEAQEPAAGFHLRLNPELQFRAGERLRLKPWVDFELERYPDDAENLAIQFEVYDALYAWCRLDVKK